MREIRIEREKGGERGRNLNHRKGKVQWIARGCVWETFGPRVSKGEVKYPQMQFDCALKNFFKNIFQRNLKSFRPGIRFEMGLTASPSPQSQFSALPHFSAEVFQTVFETWAQLLATYFIFCNQLLSKLIQRKWIWAKSLILKGSIL